MPERPGSSVDVEARAPRVPDYAPLELGDCPHPRHVLRSAASRGQESENLDPCPLEARLLGQIESAHSHAANLHGWPDAPGERVPRWVSCLSTPEHEPAVIP